MRASRLLLLWLVAASSALGEPLVLEADLPDDGPDFVLVPFTVPEGTVELEVAHPRQQADNILDYGLVDPNGFRGWGGGNSESAIVGVDAASRSYLPGALPAGTWSVVIGKAKVLVKPAHYRLEIELRPTATLPPQPQRAPFVAQTLSTTRRWYAGDLHVHSRESGDAHPTLDEVATFAQSRGLDFVELSEHNTTAQLSLMNDVQSRFPALLLLPGVEFTTYAGHANGIGATRYVDHRLGLDGVTIEGAEQAFAAQGAVFSINHPMLDLGTVCIGCAWKHPVPRELLGAVEIGTGGWDKTGELFSKRAIAWWEALSKQGLHVAPVGGSDDHLGGQGSDSTYSPLGNPTTLVLADALSPAAIVAGIKAGHTVVKLQGPADPMVEFTVNGKPVGDTVVTDAPQAHLHVTGAKGQTLVLWRESVELETRALESDDVALDEVLPGPGRYRAEVRIDGAPRTLTANLWVEQPIAPPQKTGCSVGSGVAGWLLVSALLRRRRRCA